MKKHSSAAEHSMIPAPPPREVRTNGRYDLIRRREPRPTVVYNAYWEFAAERQSIYRQRVLGKSWPWTNDEILNSYRFTNPYRASDRVSQYLIQSVQYSGDFSLRDTVFRTLLFKLFNKIETWELLEHSFGTICERNFSISAFSDVLGQALRAGASIYSAAYIMPSGSTTTRTSRKHDMHLAMLQHLLNDGFPEKLADCTAMAEGYELLLSIPSIGPFLAYQFITDLNYTAFLNFTEAEFVVPGPGAKNGLRKCFDDLGDYTEAGAIEWVMKRQQDEFDSRRLNFDDLWTRELQLIDCQNLFCEIDKYARVAYPDVKGMSNRARIKQKFAPNPTPIPTPWFPPKWGINVEIAKDLSQQLDRADCMSASGSPR